MAKPPDDASKSYFGFFLEYETKALNYLLLANGAGFAACVASLKDYATTPQLHGLGGLAAMFGYGLISAIVAFVVLQVTAVEAFHATQQFGEPKLKRLEWSGRIQNVLMLISVGCFVSGVMALINRLSSL